MSQSVTDLEEIGAAIRTARRAAGLSQRALSKRVGIPQPKFPLIERGAYGLSADQLLAITDALGIAVQFTGDNPDSPAIKLAEVTAS